MIIRLREGGGPIELENKAEKRHGAIFRGLKKERESSIIYNL
jgi:hypothetical protein